jgi:hypothetical protein
VSEAGGHATRIVTIGTDSDGRSIVASDAAGDVVYSSPVLVSTAVWEAANLPATVGDDHTPDPARYLPPAGGLRVFMSSFAPNKAWSGDPETRATALRAAGLDPDAPGRVPGFHSTPTVDVIVMVAGEIHLVLHHDEVLLRPGDALIQDGAPHAWENRTDREAIVMCLMVDAVPREPRT